MNSPSSDGPNTQAHSSYMQSLPVEPPRKRRRTTKILDDSDEDSSASEDSVTLPTSPSNDYIEIDDDILGNNHSKYEHVLHEPAFVDTQRNEFVTQVEQPWSSPTRIRNPRWRKKSPTPSPARSSVIQQTKHTNRVIEKVVSTNVRVAEDFDDDELEELMANEDLTADSQTLNHGKSNVPSLQRQSSKTMRQTTLFGMHTTQREPPKQPSLTQSHSWRLAERNEPPTHHKICEEAMKKWIFPLNVGTIRDYQYNIVHKALFNNILVALPTGLGKTFIAAAVMMNWFNWTTDAQIVFLAPTKPLVAQQIEACFNIAGIPRSQTTLMTGEIPPDVRSEEWQRKRVFFMTPQTMINDLKTGIADPKRIVLVVVDEAHKATGNYAYVEVVRFLRRFNQSFRVLALTATPGSSVEAVQKVIDGLDISRVEIRTEDSLDIQKFVHQRNTELETFPYSEEIEMCLDLFSKAVQPVLDKLCSQNASWTKDPTKLSLYALNQSKKQWFSSEAGRKANAGLKGMVLNCFAPLLPLAHNLELLKFHGIGPFYRKMKTFQDDPGTGKYAKMIADSGHFHTLMNRMRAWINNDEFVGHPKLAYLKSVVLNHFLDAGNGAGRADGRPPSETRIMIFAHYRESAEEICRVLNRHQPMIRAHVFVGQSNTKGSDGMDQKTQTDVIKKFKAGTYNTLVATSIGEEGLDIGEVDLIVCYDCSKSPIRMLQRMGRTGRKRAGNIVMLLMEDKEKGAYYQAKDNYAKMQELIESGKEFQFHHDRSPRIVPKSITPAVSKEHIEIPVENTQPGSVEAVEPKKSRSKKSKKPPKKFHMPDGVETGFTFLGGKKLKTKTPAKTLEKLGKPRKRTFLDEEIAVEPADIDVLLNPEQERYLDEHYATIPGPEEQYVRRVGVSNCPDKLRQLDKTGAVGHSSKTRGLVRAFSLARSDAQYSRFPLPPTEEEMQELYSGAGRLQDAEVPFYTSQPAAMPDTSQGDDALPDLDDLFTKKSASARTKANQAKKRARKRVVSDEDDEND